MWFISCIQDTLCNVPHLVIVVVGCQAGHVSASVAGDRRPRPQGGTLPLPRAGAAAAPHARISVTEVTRGKNFIAELDFYLKQRDCRIIQIDNRHKFNYIHLSSLRSESS